MVVVVNYTDLEVFKWEAGPTVRPYLPRHDGWMDGLGIIILFTHRKTSVPRQMACIFADITFNLS